jgi:transposase
VGSGRTVYLSRQGEAQGRKTALRREACLTGIVFVLRSGIPWEMLPQELGCGSGMSCWRRLRDWQELGIWQLLHFVLLDWLARYGQIDWSRDGAESGSPGPTVTTRSKPSHSLTPSRSYRGNADDPAVVLIACWATAVMMLRRSGKVCVADASSLFLRSGRPNTTADWAGGGGSWNEPSPSSISFAACAFATKSGRTFMRHSCL